MNGFAILSAALLLTGLGANGVERKFVITSDPPGAMVFRSGVALGITPVDDYFVYYGKYRFTLVREQFQTLEKVEDICRPLYEFPGIDFFSENLNPFPIRDVHRLHYQLVPLQPVDQQDLLEKAKALKGRGQLIGTVAPQHNAPVPPPQGPQGWQVPPAGPGLPAQIVPVNPTDPVNPGPAPMPGGPAGAPVVPPAPPLLPLGTTAFPGNTPH